MFIHDALSELVVCGETDIPVASIRINISRLQKLIVGEAITGFQKQFKVIEGGVHACAKGVMVTITLNILLLSVMLLFYICVDYGANELTVPGLLH